MSDEDLEWKKKVRIGLISLVGNIIFLSLLYFFTVWVFRKVSASNATIICVIGIFIVGLILYGFRRFSRLLYGAVEIATALLIGGFTVSHSLGFRYSSFSHFVASSSSLPVLIGLVSSVYIVVRGLDNIAEGMKQEEVATTDTSEKVKDEGTSGD